jgi:hypothetical protein
MNGDLRTKLDMYYGTRKASARAAVVECIDNMPFETRVKEVHEMLAEKSVSIFEKHTIFRRVDSGVIMALYNSHLADLSTDHQSWDVLIDAIVHNKFFTLQERVRLIKPIIQIQHPMVKSAILSALELIVLKLHEKHVFDTDLQTEIFALVNDCVKVEDSDWLKEIAKSIIEDDSDE